MSQSTMTEPIMPDEDAAAVCCGQSDPAAAPVSPTPAGPSGSAPSEGQYGLASTSFVGLLLTQFLGAMNDNTFRWLSVSIGKEMVAEDYHSTVVAIGGVMLVLPFVLLAAPAAYFSDRFSKRRVIVGCKLAEIILMLGGTAAILYGNLYVMFGVLLLMGAHSTVFGPAKYGAIPEIVRPDRIPAANAWIGMSTIVAIVLGTMAGPYLASFSEPRGHTAWWLWAATIVGTATLGFGTSLLIRPLRAANPLRKIPWNIVTEAGRDLRTLVTARALFLAALGSAIFWSLGGLTQVNVDRIVTADFHLKTQDIGPLLGLLALGVAVGNVVAGFLSAGRIKLGMVPMAASGIAFGAVMLFTVPVDSPNKYWLSGLWLFVLGVSAGMYDVPLLSYLQHRSPPEKRGSILAATNFLTFSGMLLAFGVYILLSGPLQLSGRMISLVAGLGFLPVIFVTMYLIPAETARFAIWLTTRLMYRVRVVGLENLPNQGGVLVVANHVSWVDAVLLGLACPRDIRMVAFADYFQSPLMRWFGRHARIIPIRPGKRSMVESIHTARDTLRAGELVGIFPEGGISRTGEIQEFHAGFLSILKDTGCPVVPVHLGGLWGSIFSFERGRFFWKLPRRWPYPVTIRIGAPIGHPADAEQVRQAVLALEREDPPRC